MAKRTVKNQAVPLVAPAAQIQVDVKLSTPSYYVNYVAVSHTAYDFTLSVIKIPSPLTPELAELAKSGKPMLVEPMLQLTLPPLLIDGLIKALVDQKQKHEVTLAQQVKNNAAQQKQQHVKPTSRIQ
jgi:hypothetical protein